MTSRRPSASTTTKRTFAERLGQGDNPAPAFSLFFLDIILGLRGMILRVISTVITTVAAVSLLALMGLTFADVIGREFFNKPLTFSVELTKLAMGLIVCLAFGTTTYSSRHISVDLIQAFVPKPVFGLLLRLSSLMLAAFFLVLAWGLLGKANQFSGDGLATQVLFLPIAPVVYGMSVACLAAAVIAGVMVLVGSTGYSEVEEQIQEAKAQDALNSDNDPV